MFVGAVYFLIRIWNFPSISIADALLMGIALTAAFILSSYGIVSGRGTIPESALLVLPSSQESSFSLHMWCIISTFARRISCQALLIRRRHLPPIQRHLLSHLQLSISINPF